MFGSLPVGRLFGITVRVHWLWLAMVLALPLFFDEQPLATVIAFLVLFGVVLLHELGHSLMARQFRIRTLDITLWPLGGMARMDRIPESSKIEFWIAIAGPLVNFALAAFGGALLLILALSDVSANFADLRFSPVEVAWGFVLMNLAMGGFNLLPAFPMDGGRVLRAGLALFVDWVRATALAVFVGRMFAFAMIALGIAGLLFEWPNTLMLPVLGVFIWLAGANELLHVRMRRAQTDPRFAAFGFRPPFNGADTPPFQPQAPPPPGAVSSDDPSGARRPEATPPDLSADAAEGKRLSDEELERLERFQGRIRPRKDE